MRISRLDCHLHVRESALVCPPLHRRLLPVGFGLALVIGAAATTRVANTGSRHDTRLEGRRNVLAVPPVSFGYSALKVLCSKKSVLAGRKR